MKNIINNQYYKNIMKNRMLILLIIGIFLFNIVNADGDIGTVKQGNCIDLYNYCPTCTFVKWTSILYPNDTRTNGLDLTMTKSGFDYNYTFCDTSQLGEYSYTTCGDKAGDTNACEDITFEVTPSGFVWSNGLYFLLIALSIGIIVLGYYVQDAWIVVLGSFGMVLFGLFVLFYGIAGMKDPVYTWAIGIITLMLGSYFGMKGALEKLDM